MNLVLQATGPIQVVPGPFATVSFFRPDFVLRNSRGASTVVGLPHENRGRRRRTILSASNRVSRTQRDPFC